MALDTTLLWDQYCMIRLRVIYRGRAVPRAWPVVEQRSAQVAFCVYRDLLQRAAKLLPPGIPQVVLLADRGCADVALMRLCARLGGGIACGSSVISWSSGGAMGVHSLSNCSRSGGARPFFCMRWP